MATPTIVSVIKKSSDTSLCYNASEEEWPDKKIKTDFNFKTEYHFVNLSGYISSLILSEILSKHDDVFTSTFTPPPEQA